ncbi:hypothetical protein [Halioxenophilus sp. WMMB6]|uniref:hypothetical protein n=1 Tax=Halioxenophilus sp. WMMB6 TaxID=3073815 RepID=UPI00295EE0C5|nr:hypothetical protein [Halioxenophilus sp. WMMB6]
MLRNNRYWQALKQHYSASLVDVFKQFRLGASLFFTGMVGVYAGMNIESSWTQEIILVAGIVLVGAGFLIAMLAHVRMIIIRLVSFFKK